MKRYINTKTSEGVETVDELDSNDFESYKAFRQEVICLVGEYEMAFNAPCWHSQRATKEWRER